MKRLSALCLAALVCAITACEKHPASELPAEFREGEKGAKPEAAAEAAKPVAEAAKPGDAPKYFPEKK